MKVALVHDYIKEYGGAERVLEALHELYPDAPVYTSVYLPQYLGPHQERFKDWDIRTSFLQDFPMKAKLISPFRLLAPFACKQFDFSKYDVVIVSATGAYAPNIVNKKSAVQICYCHTPARYLYGYATAREWKKNPVTKLLGSMFSKYLRGIDGKSAKNVDYFIANSQEVAARIKRIYRRDATVIYPPVDVRGPAASFPPARVPSTSSVHAVGSPSSGVTPYYLAGGRLARPKHIDVIVKTCVEHNLPLKIFGKQFAGYGDELKAQSEKSKTKNIEFLGEITDEEKFDLMQNAKAYIFAAVDEDFGITPVEAMAAGTPVIAYRSGGVKETVVDGKTGVFFDELTVESLAKAIKRLSTLSISSDTCKKHAILFGTDRFKKEIAAFVKKVNHS